MSGTPVTRTLRNRVIKGLVLNPEPEPIPLDWSEANIEFEEETGSIRVPYPASDTLVCACKKSYRGDRKHKRIERLLTHVTKEHWNGNKETKPHIVLYCPACGYEANKHMTLKAHQCGQEADQTTSNNCPVTEFRNGVLLIPYRIDRSRCHQCKEFTCHGTTVAGMARHSRNISTRNTRWKTCKPTGYAWIAATSKISTK